MRKFQTHYLAALSIVVVSAFTDSKGFANETTIAASLDGHEN